MGPTSRQSLRCDESAQKTKTSCKKRCKCRGTPGVAGDANRPIEHKREAGSLRQQLFDTDVPIKNLSPFGWEPITPPMELATLAYQVPMDFGEL